MPKSLKLTILQTEKKIVFGKSVIRGKKKKRKKRRDGLFAEGAYFNLR